MEKNLEIEFKTKLTENEYNRLLPLFSNPYEQENFYFDTNDFTLSLEKKTCRIRKKNNLYEFTVKTPNKIGTNEYNSLISKENFDIYMKNGIELDFEFLNKYYVFFIGSNKTLRYDLHYKNCLFSLDRVLIEKQIYYELEMETDNYDYGKQIFMDFLKFHKIEYKKNISKSKNTILYYHNKMLHIE